MRRVVHPFKQARDHATGNRELVAKESLSADEQIEGVVCDRRGSFLKNVTFRPSGIAYGQASFLLLSGFPLSSCKSRRAFRALFCPALISDGRSFFRNQ